MSLLPKVRRGTPEAASMPGREASIPRKPAISPLSSEPWLTAAISTRAIIIKVKNSQGPKLTDQRARGGRSEEHTSELQSLMRISYAVFCLKKKKYIYA